MPFTTSTPLFDSKEVERSPLTAVGDRARLLADTRFTRKLTAVHKKFRMSQRRSFRKLFGGLGRILPCVPCSS